MDQDHPEGKMNGQKATLMFVAKEIGGYKIFRRTPDGRAVGYPPYMVMDKSGILSWSFNNLRKAVRFAEEKSGVAHGR